MPNLLEPYHPLSYYMFMSATVWYTAIFGGVLFYLLNRSKENTLESSVFTYLGIGHTQKRIISKNIVLANFWLKVFWVGSFWEMR